MGTKHTVGIRGRMGNPVFEKEPPGIPGNAGAGNQAGRGQSSTAETDE